MLILPFLEDSNEKGTDEYAIKSTSVNEVSSYKKGKRSNYYD